MFPVKDYVVVPDHHSATPYHTLIFFFALIAAVDVLKFVTTTAIGLTLYVTFHVVVYRLSETYRMESQAVELLTVLRNPNTSIDAKIACLSNLKSDIKQKNVPETAIPPIFEGTRLAIAAQHSSLCSAGFSALGHFLKRLYIQEFDSVIAASARQFYSLLLERLGDHKERLRIQSAQAFTDFYPAAPEEVEHHVLDVALVGKNPRAKEMSMTWLVTMTRDHGLKFRAYVPALIAGLEDADGGVRDTAKSTVIEIFQTAPSRAKSDLKKQLVEYNVRKSIAAAILSSLDLSVQDISSLTSNTRSESRRPGSSLAVSRNREEIPRPNSVLSTRPQSRVEISREDSDLPKRPGTSKGEPPRGGLSLSESIDSLAGSAPAVVEGEKIDPLYVDSNRDIDDMVRDMLPHFEGRESEQNWIPREKSMMTLRRLTHGNAPEAFSQHYFAGIKALLDGILKVVNSLRTTLSTSGCLLIQDVARICGPGIDHMVEILLQNMIKMCAGMKKISAQNGNATVDVIIQNVTYVPRILQHLWFACQDKNVQPRLYATGWLKTLLNKQARHKSSIEHGGGLDLVEKCIKKGLADANPGVREAMRGTFWTFHQIRPDRADEIMSDLDNKSKSLLEKDPSNPNATTASPARPRPGFSSSVSAAGARQTLKDTIAAQKKRLAEAKSMPPRPESAQSTFTDTKPTRAPARPPTSQANYSVRTVPTGTHLSSLSSAPMRPGSKPRRPEIQRPATADPYADRRPLSAASHTKNISPDTSPAKPKSRMVTTPGVKSPARPKSRAGAAPVSSSKGKPKRLDISALRAGAATTHIRSNSDDIVRSQPPTNDDFARAVPLEHMPVENTVEIPTDILPADAVTENDLNSHAEATVDISQEEPVMLTDEISILREKLPSPMRDASTGTVIQKSLLKHQDLPTDTEDLKVNSFMQRSPQHRHSPHKDEEKFVAVPSPTLSRSTPREGHLVNLQVYEDPESAAAAGRSPTAGSTQSPMPQFANKKSVLEELPVNEPKQVAHRDNKSLSIPERANNTNMIIPPGGSENSHIRWGKIESLERRRSISPRSKDPAKAREMIEKGIMRIRTKSLDAHGYRKLQVLIRFHDSIFNDEDKYDEMLLALLEALESSNDEKRSGSSRSMDIKTQILVTIRLMFTYNRTYFAAYYPRVVTALLNARKQYELTNHIVSGLEETAEDVVAACQPPDVIDAVLNLIETENHDDEGYRAITMGIYVLSGLLKRLNSHHIHLSQIEMERLGKFANRSLTQPQPDIRRAITEFCVELHEMVNTDEIFWRMINSPMGDHRNLLTYYIAKKKAVQSV